MNKKILLCFYFLSCTSSPGYKGPKSDHFNGKTFFNKYGKMKNDFFSFLKWRFTANKGPWPNWVKNKLSTKPTKRIKESSLTATFINHATVLIQFGNINIITDPIFSKRCSPFSWIGPKRVREPGVKFEDLPPIDIVLISHNHYDHLDIPTLKKLAKRDNPIIISGLGNGQLFEKNQLKNYKDLDWGDTLELKGLKFHFLVAQHWSGRGLTDRLQTLWGSFLIEKDGKKVYFAGDTGYGPHFKDHGNTFAPVDLALLPIGAYRPRWFMKFAHMSPQDALKAHLDLKSKRSIGIHFGTFSLGDDAFDDPIKDLKKEREKMGINEKDFIAPEFGEVVNLR